MNVYSQLIKAKFEQTSSDLAETLSGLFWHNTTSKKLKFYDGTGVKELADTDSTQTLTNKVIDSDSNAITNIDNADIKSAAAIDATKIADGSVTSTKFQYINTLSSNAQTQITAGVTATALVQTNLDTHIADTSTHGVSGDVVGTTDSQTLTNKIINASANTLQNVANTNIANGAAIDAAKIADGSVSSTEFQYINTLSSNAQTQITDGVTATALVQTNLTNHEADTSTHGVSTIVGISESQTLTNKTINASNNTIQNIANTNVANGAAIAATKIANTPTGNLSATDQQGVNDELQTDIDTINTDIAHDNLPVNRPSFLLDFANSKSLDSRVAFSRASTATFINAKGVIEAAAINVPRFNHDMATLESKGLLIEEARTNLLLNSETLSTQSATVTAAAHTLSFYGTGTITLTGTSTAGPLVGTATNEKVSLTFTPTAGALTLTVSGSVKYANLELGAFGTSWIPTVGSTVSRSADSASVTGTNFSSWYRADEGTFVVKGNSVNAITGSTARRFIEASDGTANNIFSLEYRDTTVSRLTVINGGVSQAVVTGVGTIATTSLLSSNYVLNSVNLSTNGTNSTEDTSVTIPTVTLLNIGNRYDGNAAGCINGHIGKIAYFPKKASPTELNANSNLNGLLGNGANQAPVNETLGTMAFEDSNNYLKYASDDVVFKKQPAITSKGAAATLTASELRAQIIQYTGAAAALTLPTGTDLQTSIGDGTNLAFDFSVINTGSGTATVTTNTGMTLVGLMTVAASTSGSFRAKRTGTNTFTIYRMS